MTKRTKQIHKLFEAKAMEKLWCAWCKKWGNHRSGNCPDKDSKMLEKMFKGCGRPIKFKTLPPIKIKGIGGKVGFDKRGDFYTELDCTAFDGCKSTTPNLKRKL